jgi:hypothetical protein
MKSRGLIYGLLIIAILGILFIFMVFGMSPMESPNENVIRFGYTNWSGDSDPIVYGKTVWERFSDFPGDSTIEHSYTIKVEHIIHWGIIPVDSESMSWEVENGTFSSNSLTYNDLMDRWRDSEAVFAFKHEDALLKVSFSVPKLENGEDKYDTLLDAWEEMELLQIVKG